MIFLALGSNLAGEYPDCRTVLQAACDVLPLYGITVEQKSSLWLTEPVPVSDDPWYHNAVIEVSTDLSPELLLATLKDIEGQFGQRMDARNSPRVLDIDILAYNDIICTGNAPLIPHPRLQSRAFVLFPLVEVASDWVHPVSGFSVQTMISTLEFHPQSIHRKGIF